MLLFVVIVEMLMIEYMEVKGFVLFEIVILICTKIIALRITINHYKKASEIDKKESR